MDFGATMSKRDKNLLILLGGIILVALAYFFGYLKIQAATDQARSDVAQMESQYQSRLDILASREQYEKETTQNEEEYNAMLTRYPKGISQDDQIMFVYSLENEFRTKFESLDFSDSAPIYTLATGAADTGNPYVLESSTLNFPVQLTYPEWKRFIDYVAAYQEGRNVMTNIDAAYDHEADLVNATVTLNQYAITGDDRHFVPASASSSTGTSNMFNSGAPLNLGGTSAEQFEEIKSDYQLYVMLYPSNSDVSAKTIASPDGTKKSTSSENAAEDLTIRLKENEDGTLTLTAQLGNREVVTLDTFEGDTADVYVLSSARKAAGDMSAVEGIAENLTDRTLRIAVDSDDTNNPRFQMQDQTGSVVVVYGSSDGQ